MVTICNDKRKFPFQETKDKAELSYHQNSIFASTSCVPSTAMSVEHTATK